MKSSIAVALVLSLSALCADPLQEAKNPDKRVQLRTEAMSGAAGAWLASLPEELRQRANPPFDSDVRKEWGYMGGSRSGVAFGEQNPEERRLLDLLLREALSPTGYLKVHAIASLEEVLERDPDAYFMTVFGDPAGEEPWGWRLEGHHVSLNFTLRRNQFIAATPLFLGADPARVEQGPRSGLEIFYPEEELARALLASFSEGTRTRGAQKGAPPDDVLLGPGKDQLFQERAGVPPGDMMASVGFFMKLFNLHTSVLHPDIAVLAMDAYREHDVKDLDFVWSGTGAPGTPFYYRIQGVRKGVSVEYVNRGNHVHCLWRDAKLDFGAGPVGALGAEPAAEESGEEDGD